MLLVINAQKIYNVIAKIKRNRIQGRNKVEEVLCLSTQRDYTVFHRNREESNVLSDIVVAHPTSIAIIRTWPYVLIMDTTYKTNTYNMRLLEAVGITPTGKNFTVATAFMCNEQMVKNEEVAQQFVTGLWKKLINEIDEVEYQKNRLDFLHYLFSTWLNPFAHKFCQVWTSQVLHFGVETTNCAESEHSVLKLLLSTCHGDLDTVFSNIDSLIQCQIAEIKYTLEISKLKRSMSLRVMPY
ncbi:hypothetical protein M9H77_30261 [Catharanthus roseus]|uniref:Uncharacterized protein n=1 Tax=Catharanthus roseus TaxID=4058 RepID=A0ACB9ZXK7_CATRO|nr:hypothetical protein M9H77_30261 [Catharanthus roseus]